MGFFDSRSKKSSDERSVQDLIKIVRSDPKGRYAALVLLKKIGNPNAIDTFYEMLNDPSSRIRRISIEALGEMGNTSAISSLANLINTNDFSPTGKRTNFGHAENIILAKEAIGKIQQRSNTYETIKTEIPQSPPHPLPLNNGVNWTTEDIQVLRQSWGERKFIHEIVNRLNRSADSIVHKLIETGLIGYNDDNCYPKPARFGFTWSDQERTQLISELKSGKSIPEIANIHQRNKNSILHTMVSLKTFNYNDSNLLEIYTEKSVALDTNQLIRTLVSELENNSNIDIRNSAATQLGSFPEPSVVNALIKCVKNDPKVRYRALVALRNIGDTLTIPVFIERSKDPSVKIRLVSVNALGEIGDSTVIKHLESLIKSKDHQNILKYGGNPEIIQAARDAIQKIRLKEHSGEPQPDLPEDSSDTHVLSSIQEIDARIKKGLAREIVANGELPFIINSAQNNHNDIRMHANYALGNLALNGEGEQVIQAGALPILIGALSDPYHRARSSSAWALSALAEKGQAQNLEKMGVIQPLITGLKDSDNLVRGCSARALDAIAYAGFANDLITCNAVPPLVQNLEDYFDNVRKKSIWALWSIAIKGKTDIFGQDSVLKPLIKYVLDKDVEVRSGSLHLLGVLGRKGLSERIIIAGITSPLIKSLSSRSRRVRGAAAWALGEIDQGITGDEFIQGGAIAELEKISDNSNKILIFNETQSSWIDKSIHEIVENTLCILRKKEQSVLDEKLELTLSLDRTQLSAERSHKLGITLTNTGASPVENVFLTFSNEFETKGIKPISVKAGQSSRMDISIFPKTVGNILLEITLTYKDIKGREYKKVQEFWIDVISDPTPFTPVGTPNRTPQDTPEIGFTPRELPHELAAYYLVTSYLGKGGFARVFRAKKQDGTEVALKIPISLDKNSGRAFYNEMQHWTQMVHPNIVRVYDFSITPIPYLELELCDQSLDKLPKPMPVDEAAWIIFYISEGLKYAHAKGIIHRDLKPQNILLKDGIPKISDWGLAKVTAETRLSTVSIFTLHYAAPEQIDNRSKDERTDIWQLGVILYELVTGTVPFKGNNIEVLSGITLKPATPPSAINTEATILDTVTLKCLEKDPAKRYQTVKELQKDLAHILNITIPIIVEKSTQIGNMLKSALFCGDLVMINLLTGNMKSAYKYLLDLVQYTRGDVKVQVQELSEQLKMRMEMGVTEIPPELIEKAEILVHQVSMGVRNREYQE